MLQKRPCVVFDLDGTLADTSLDLLGAANACFQEMGFGDLLTPADTAAALTGGRAMLRLGLSRQGAVDEAVVMAWYPKLLAYYERNIANHTRFYPGAVEVLEDLRAKGYALAVCTNKPVALAERLLADLGLRAHFDALVGAGSLSVVKPDPAPYLLAVEQAGGDLARSVMIGDTLTDINTAKAVARPVLMVTFGAEAHKLAELDYDASFGHYHELPDLIAQYI